MTLTERIDLHQPGACDRVLACLDRGGLVAVPTETVYGLAADARNGAAVAGIFEAKGRPHFNPLISHVDGITMAERFVCIDQVALCLMERFWPGPLTLVLPLRDGAELHPLTSAGLPTAAVRAPRGPLNPILSAFGRPVAAPSANRSGRVSPTTADHVLRTLDGRIDLVADGGPTAHGLESTVVRPEADRIVLLRPGTVTASEITDASGLPVVRRGEVDIIDAPGQLLSHYAPHGRVRLEADAPATGEYWIAFGDRPVPGIEGAAGVFQLSASGDLREAASRLFAALTAFDAPEIERIAIAPIPHHGLGEAINDRLRRAAAER